LGFVPKCAFERVLSSEIFSGKRRVKAQNLTGTGIIGWLGVFGNLSNELKKAFHALVL